MRECYIGIWFSSGFWYLIFVFRYKSMGPNFGTRCTICIVKEWRTPRVNHHINVMFLYIEIKYEVCSIEFDIWSIVRRKLKWCHYLFDFYKKWTTNLLRVYLSDILNFIFIGHKRAEIQSREVNEELWRKNGYYVTVTLTFDPRSPNSIGSEPMR